MKKAVPITLLIAIFAIAIFLWKKQGLLQPPRTLATLAPAEAMAFFQLPNLARTEQRWPATELAQVWAEPQVQAFFEKPLSQIPKDLPARKNWQKIKPRGGFVTLARLEQNRPIATLGFEYNGERKEVEKTLQDLKKQLQEAQPDGKADLVQYGDVAIETFTTKEMTLAMALVHDWGFVSTDVEELKATLDRLLGKSKTPTLAQSDLYKKTYSHLPADPDAIFFLNPKELIGRLEGLMAATGQPVDRSGLEKLKKVRAFGGATKIDGALIREVWYSDQPDLPTPGDLKQNVLALTSPATLIYFSTLLQWPEHLPPVEAGAADQFGINAFMLSLQTDLAAQGLKFEDVMKALGPEAGLSVDWPEGGGQPTGVFALDIKNRATLQKALDLTTNRPGSAPWAKQTVGGVDYYGMPALGFAAIKPTLALSDHFLIGGLGYEAVKKAADDAGKTGGKLDETPAFQDAKKTVAAPDSGIGYLDSAKLFQNAYGQLRPMLMLYASFSKEANEYVDASKLPEAGVIAKHLTPIIYTSGKTADGGVLIESAGPVTFTQAMFGLGTTAGAIAVPFVKNYLPNLNGTTLPGVLNPTPPASSTPVVPAAPEPTPTSAPTEPPQSTPGAPENGTLTPSAPGN